MAKINISSVLRRKGKRTITKTLKHLKYRVQTQIYIIIKKFKKKYLLID